MIRLPAALCGGLLLLAAPATAQQREPWQIITPAQASLVLARDGSLIGEVGRERRVSIALSSLPPYVGRAFVAIEDQRFYLHDGVDVVGIFDRPTPISGAAAGGERWRHPRGDAWSRVSIERAGTGSSGRLRRG